LRITSIDVSPSSPIVAYAPVTFTVDIVNDGPGDALSLFWVDLYIDPVPAPPQANQSNGDATWNAVGFLGAGDTTTVNLYHYFTVSGAHTAYAYVDTRTDVEERIEDNNVIGPLNLTITAGTPPTATLTTDPLCSAAGVSTTVTVSGEGWPTDEGDITIRWDSTNKITFAPQSAWSQDITIDAGEATMGTHTIWASTSGTVVNSPYYIDCSVVGDIDGYTWIFIGGRVVPQERVEVTVLDPGGNPVAEVDSDDDAYYIASGLSPASGYTVIGRISIDGVLYMDTVTGVQVIPNSATRVNLVLLPQY
jgi:hypothetical protein